MKKFLSFLVLGIFVGVGFYAFATPVTASITGARAAYIASVYGQVNAAISGYKSSFNIPNHKNIRRVGVKNRTASATVLYVSFNRASIYGAHANEVATTAASATATLDAAITGLRVGDILQFTEAGADYGPHMITAMSTDGLTLTLNPAPTLTTANMDFSLSEVVVPAATETPIWFEINPESIGVGSNDDDCAYQLILEYVD
jgi:hypothetical protein